MGTVWHESRKNKEYKSYILLEKVSEHYDLDVFRAIILDVLGPS